MVCIIKSNNVKCYMIPEKPILSSRESCVRTSFTPERPAVYEWITDALIKFDAKTQWHQSSGSDIYLD